MRRSLSRSGPMWRSANEEALIGGTPGGREVEVDEQPPPLSYPERVLQSRHVRAVLLPERFRGGFAPSAPPGLATGDLSHAEVSAGLTLPVLMFPRTSHLRCRA